METVNQLLIDCGVATVTLPGQTESGDRHAIKAFSNGALVGVVDGLGHGNEAALAAKVATRTLEDHAEESVIPLLKRCHESLRPTRGVVMSIASFNTLEGTMTWLGVGNVHGILFRADPAANPPREFLLLRGGVVGGKYDRPFASIVPIASGDTLIFATDGILTDFESGLSPNSESTQQVADQILSRYWKRNDDALVLVARYRGSAT